MRRVGPVSRKELIATLRRLGFGGLFQAAAINSWCEQVEKFSSLTLILETLGASY